MAKLNDLQLILLTTGSQRTDLSVIPVPENLADQTKRIRTAIGGLLKRQFVAEVADVPSTRSWRVDGDSHVGLVITDAGLSAIGLPVGDALSAPGSGEGLSPVEPDVSPLPSVARAGTKQATVINMLQRPEGATLGDLVDATGWLPHTTRAALTGLRKKGHAIAKSKRDEATCYRIEGC